MNIESLIGRATQEECEYLAVAALESLPEQALFRVLNQVLEQMQKEELAAQWEAA
jgi:hypothetical protein